MHNTDKSQESSIQPVFMRSFVYLTYFDRQVSYLKPELNDQNRENSNQEQEQDLSWEDINQIYTPQKQSNVKKMQENWDISK